MIVYLLMHRNMTLEQFEQSLQNAAPPAGASLALRALWMDAQDDWHAAHELAQQEDEQGGAWVHAYLHRKEGDRYNAGYWYRRAGKPFFEGDLKAEWKAIVQALLETGISGSS